MKLLILHDRNGKNIADQLVQVGEKSGCEVSAVALNCDEINPCKGCFSCWIRTPGICAITDDGVNKLAKDFMNAQVVVFLSQVIYGSYSPDIKAFLDRSIQNMSPYFETINGEMHHKRRYKTYPNWINMGYGDMTDQEEETFKQLTMRNALNFFPKKSYCLVARHPSAITEKMKELQDILEGAQ